VAMKKIVYIILLLLVCSLMTACDEDPFKPVVSGDFIYSRVGVPVKGTVAIIGLSEEGKTKETLVFPTEIDGYRVFMIGTSFFMHRSSGSIFIEHAKNVYYTSQHDLVEVSIFYDRMTDD